MRTAHHTGISSRYAGLALLKVEPRQSGHQVRNWRVGTAYALTDRILVTARHVWFGPAGNDWVAVDGSVLSVNSAAEPVWRVVELCWQEPQRELCLLRVVEGPLPSGLGAGPRFGFYDRSRAVAWEGAGFPGAAVVAEADGFLREVADASGRLGPAGGLRRCLFALTVEAGPASARDWEGMSGAPVFADGNLVAVVHSVLDSFAGRRLEAIPLAPVLEEPAVRRLLGEPRVHQVPRGTLVLPEPVPVLAKDARPSTLLQARQRVVPFDRELRAQEFPVIANWLDSSAHVRLELITGAGGTGKTRLLLELCEERRRAGWHAGFLPFGLGESERAQIALDPRPALVCIDYAEARPILGTELERLLAGMADRAAALRVLLVARAAADWWPALVERPAFKDLTLGSRPLPLTAVELDGNARRRVVTSAAQSFAATRGMDVAPALARLSEQDLSAPELGRTLYLQMLALAAIDGLPIVRGELLEAMLSREAELWRKWQQAGNDDEQRAWIGELRRTIAVLTLQGGASSREHALRMVEHSRGPQPYDRTVDLLRRLHPGSGQPHTARSYLDPLEPDLIGESLVRAVLSEEASDFMDRALAPVPPSNQRIAFTVLGRLSARDPARVRPWIDALLGTDADTVLERAESAFDAALSLTETREGSDNLLGRVLSETLVRVCSRDRPDGRVQELARMMHEQIPDRALSLAELGVWAARIVAEHTEGEPRARVLIILGNRLNAVGDNDGALKVTREAVEEYRQLASSRPDAFLPHLAMSLNNLGTALSAVGDNDGALKVTREAVEEYRQLASSRPDAFLPHLATSLNNLGNRLSAVGDREGALKATREAVEEYRQFASLRPDKFLPDLARSLNNLGIRLGDMGDRDGALKVTREAVEEYRKLALSRPDAFLPDLANSLDNLGKARSDVGDREGALSATSEAMELHRQLASSRPDAFLPDLAKSLDNLGLWLRALGDRDGALKATREALELRRQFALSRPDAFLPDLARSLNNFGNQLSAVGDHDGALKVTREAVELRRQLASLRPDAFLPELAASLNNLGFDLSAAGDHAGALKVTREAVEEYRQLASSRPDAFLPDLARSLNNLGIRLSAVGDREGALKVTREAVELRRQLASSRPDAFLPELAGSLNNLGFDLSAVGDREGALKVTREAVELFRKLTEGWPRRFREDLGKSVTNLRLQLATAGGDPNGEVELARAEAVLAEIENASRKRE